ncbi:MAG: 16S rRNA (adenine(1518)-N(6)/adenine(1519)-N(6))-dimethyltransferase RsmA [Deltaproteobacteria bacterium]|jgi:16S rRNA (adenine1518-N6/adenine1519-N6)-dimethyltransferase|nr:16S rRNA (adenine(1518)-N(6)/adenine(1519)-N(6))-dimethyltransferase RsmA [Deltaproteobacteria bacterium]
MASGSEMKNPRLNLKELGLAPIRLRSQNFLKDTRVSEKISSLILNEASENTKILEIGPGLGALTRPLLDKGAEVVAIELDKGLAEQMLAFPEVKTGKLKVIIGDALKIKAEDLPEGLFLVCGNLPYNISTPLLFWFLEVFSAQSSGIFMLQKEFAEKLIAKPKTKEYGRLTVALSTFFKISIPYHVNPSAFHPKPKVESSVVIFRPKEGKAEIDIKVLEKLTRIAFHSRRKTILNNLLQAFEKEKVIKLLDDLGLLPSQRPETITPEIYVEMARMLLG